MIPITEINAAATRFHVLAETIEKDYVISWILFYLSKSELRDNFIFYGGTAIKRIYFEEHRFSEDIDLLSQHYFTSDYLLEKLRIFQCAHEEINLVLEVNQNDVIALKNHTQILVRYSGYDEIASAPKEIRMDFSMRMNLYGEMAEEKIIESYSDTKMQNNTLPVLTLNTIFANKLGLLIDLTRNEPRDFFDIWFLLQRTHKFDFNFGSVCKIFNEKYGFYPSLSVLKPRLQSGFLKTHWEQRLRKQVAELPDLEIVIRDINAGLKRLF